MDWINYVITIGSLIGAILAWIAKLRWSQEFTDAKNAVIESKDEQIKSKEALISSLREHIDQLNEIHSLKTIEYFKAVKNELEAYIEKLNNELKTTNAKLKEKEEEIREKAAFEKEVSIKVNQELIEIRRAHDLKVNQIREAIANLRSSVQSMESLENIKNEESSRNLAEGQPNQR